MSDLLKIVGLTEAQFNALHENGSVTINGTTLNYSEDILYLVETNETAGSGGNVDLSGYLPTSGGTISGDLTLYAASGDSPKLRLQRGDNTGTITDWNINVASGALNFNTVATSGSTAEKTIISVGYTGEVNVAGTIKEDGTALANKYQAKGSYASPSDVSTALSTAKSYTDSETSNIQTQLNGKLPVFTQSSYNANTAYDAGLYMVANGSNLPSGSPYGSLLTLPYRKGSGNNSPDFGTQIFIPNGDDATLPNSMFFRTSLSGQWNAWQEVAKKSDIPAYSVATASTAGLVKPVSVITKPTLNSVTTTAGKYYQVQMSSDGNMFVNVPWSAGSTSLSSLGITATAAELNYTDGVTSNIQTQLNGKLGTTDSASFVKSNAANNNTDVAQPVALLSSNAAGVGDALYKTSNFTYNAQTGVLNNACIPYAVKSTSSSTTDGTKGAVRIRVYGGNLYIYTS